MAIDRKSIGRLLVTAVAVLVVAALGVSVALASHIDPVSVDATNKHCGLNVTVEWGLNADETSVDSYVVGYANGNKKGTESVNIADFQPDFSTWKGWVYVGHSEWDTVDLHVNDVVVTDIPYHCRAGYPQFMQTWWFSVQDLGSTSQYVSDGSQACGVFDVQGWGAKTVDLTAYPDCSGEVSVMCLDGEGNWTDTNVHNLTQNGTVVQWTSSQEGTCAFFEQ